MMLGTFQTSHEWPYTTDVIDVFFHAPHSSYPALRSIHMAYFQWSYSIRLIHNASCLVIQFNIVVAGSTNFDNFLLFHCKDSINSYKKGHTAYRKQKNIQLKQWDDEEINWSSDSTLCWRRTWIYSVILHYIVVYRKTGYLNSKPKLT